MSGAVLFVIAYWLWVSREVLFVTVDCVGGVRFVIVSGEVLFGIVVCLCKGEVVCVS